MNLSSVPPSSRTLLLILLYVTVKPAQAFSTGTPAVGGHRLGEGARTTFGHSATSTHGSANLHGVSRAMAQSDGSTEPATWPPTDRLSDYVSESNLVDYSKLANEEGTWLAPVIGQIKTTDPRQMGSAERHAFLINAYNLWTLHWVIRERRWPWWKGAVSTLAKARFFYWHRIATGAGPRNLFNFENKVRVHVQLSCLTHLSTKVTLAHDNSTTISSCCSVQFPALRIPWIRTVPRCRILFLPGLTELGLIRANMQIIPRYTNRQHILIVRKRVLRILLCCKYTTARHKRGCALLHCRDW